MCQRQKPKVLPRLGSFPLLTFSKGNPDHPSRFSPRGPRRRPWSRPLPSPSPQTPSPAPVQRPCPKIFSQILRRRSIIAINQGAVKKRRRSPIPYFYTFKKQPRSQGQLNQRNQIENWQIEKYNISIRSFFFSGRFPISLCATLFTIFIRKHHIGNLTGGGRGSETHIFLQICQYNINQLFHPPPNISSISISPPALFFFSNSLFSRGVGRFAKLPKCYLRTEPWTQLPQFSAQATDSPSETQHAVWPLEDCLRFLFFFPFSFPFRSFFDYFSNSTDPIRET